ncbi:glutamate racemase [Orbaceae bacterium ESL0727]|nr:glutamate racemase [Orbaceae bacterium ESL0727]
MHNDQKTPSILIFDSGIGGLSVYNEIRKKYPALHYIYLFDNAMFPYGDKSNDFLVERVNRIIDAVIQSYPINLAVIACNTASTICLPSLRARFSFPIVGVVPAIKPASQLTKNGCIGLLATKATIKRAYTNNLIAQFAANCQVKLLGLSELALMAENKLQGIPVNMQELERLLQPWLTLDTIPDTIVLGCTHYPFIRDELQHVFPQSMFIDSGNAVAARVGSLLSKQYNLNQIDQLCESNIVASTLCNEHVTKIVEKLGKYNFNKYQVIKLLGD